MEVKDFPNYLIYPDGRVFSKNRKSKEPMKQQINNDYFVVNLYKNSKPTQKRIHRLIAEHYIPNPDNKPFVDHKNRDKKDNRIENLRWVNGSENNLNKGIKITNTTGFKWICPNDCRQYKYLRFQRRKCKSIQSKDLSKLLCYSFFYLLKYPIDK